MIICLFPPEFRLSAYALDTDTDVDIQVWIFVIEILSDEVTNALPFTYNVTADNQAILYQYVCPMGKI